MTKKAEGVVAAFAAAKSEREYRAARRRACGLIPAEQLEVVDALLDAEGRLGLMQGRAR